LPAWPAAAGSAAPEHLTCRDSCIKQDPIPEEDVTMPSKVKAIPQGFHTITPNLTAKGAAGAIEFYKKAFGAEVRLNMPGPDGKRVMHAELRIGDSIFFLADEFPEMGALSPKTLNGTPVSMYLYVEDVDALFKRAVAAGATVTLPPTDMFWGDRNGQVLDPYGHKWTISSHVEDVPPAEMAKRQEKFFAEMAKGRKS
jgi:uncharacterized glyoxalase superfamily protein PhnB